MTAIQDAISTSQTTDGAKNTLQYVNVKGNYNTNGYINIGAKLGKTDMNIGLSLDGNSSHVNNLVNGQTNTSNNSNFTAGPDLRYEKEDKFEFSFNPGITYNINRSTININSVDYWVFNGGFRGDVQITKRLEVNSTVDVMIRQATAVFTSNNNVVKWNAYVSMKFLKKSDLELRASVFDILNQNIGYTRTAQGNMVTQNNYNTIRRYGMLSLIWNFTHTPTAAPAAE